MRNSHSQLLSVTVQILVEIKKHWISPEMLTERAWKRQKTAA
jgi:hypothetical protein